MNLIFKRLIFPKPNTVNKVNKFVTVFAVTPQPTLRCKTQLVPIHRDAFLARTVLLNNPRNNNN